MKKEYKQLINELPIEGFQHEISAEDMDRLKKVLLNAAIDINEFCKRHSITMYLVGGSCLGAIRHKGFIPWDDDLDVSMTRHDYEIFKEYFEKEYGEKYTLNAPNYSEKPITRFPKLLINSTTVETMEEYDENLSKAFVDIFILENIPENYFIRKIKGLIATILMGISSYVYSYVYDNEKTKRFMMQSDKAYKEYKKRKTIGWVLSFISLKTWLNLCDKSFQYKKETNYMGIPSGRKHYWGEILSRDTFFPSSNVVFEGIDFESFHDCHRYLTNLYGNYMEIPPMNKREKHMIVDIKFDDRFNDNK